MALYFSELELYSKINLEMRNFFRIFKGVEGGFFGSVDEK